MDWEPDPYKRNTMALGQELSPEWRLRCLHRFAGLLFNRSKVCLFDKPGQVVHVFKERFQPADSRLFPIRLRSRRDGTFSRQSRVMAYTSSGSP